MIRLDPPPEPAAFHEKVRARGLSWIEGRLLPAVESLHAAPPEDAPRRAGELRTLLRNAPPHWRACERDLARGVHYYCGYTGATVRHGSIDHHLPRSRYPDLAYEWENLRHVSSRLNARKQDVELLDPYQVQDDWFDLDLPSMVLGPVERNIPTGLRQLARLTVRRLRLDRDPALIEERLAYYQAFRVRGTKTLPDLGDELPILGLAVRRRLGGGPAELGLRKAWQRFLQGGCNLAQLRHAAPTMARWVEERLPIAATPSGAQRP